MSKKNVHSFVVCEIGYIPILNDMTWVLQRVMYQLPHSKIPYPKNAVENMAENSVDS